MSALKLRGFQGAPRGEKSRKVRFYELNTRGHTEPEGREPMSQDYMIHMQFSEDSVF